MDEVYATEPVGELSPRMSSMTPRPLRALVALALLACFVPTASASVAPTVAAGSYHGCSLRPSGGVVCWGDGSSGQLGTGVPLAYSATPVLVLLPAGRTATAVSDGLDHACALLDDGTVACWGANTGGELGISSNTASSNTPVIVTMPTTHHAMSVTVGASHTCAMLETESAVCWGDNASGQLGVSGPKSSFLPLVVAFPVADKPTQIVAGNATTCAVLVGGAVDCWGSNGSGQLGTGGAGPMMDLPARTNMSADVTRLTLGSAHVCALTTAGYVWCWGNDAAGQLGNGVIDNAPQGTPKKVTLSGMVGSVSAGANHTCALLIGGATSCWGDNGAGQLGIAGTLKTGNPIVTPMPSGRHAMQLSAGWFTTCAVLDNAAITCWGQASLIAPIVESQTATPTIAATGSADLSLTITPAATGPLAFGATRDVVVTVTNAGFDTADGVEVSRAWTGLVLTTTPTASQGSAITVSTWRFGSIPAGSSATLTLHLLAIAPGARSVTAEVSASATPDPDSTPGNHVASEDDQATVDVVAIRAVGPTLTVSLSPTHGRRAPYTFTVSGALVSPVARLVTACSDSVRVTVTVATHVVSSGRARLKMVGTVCRYTLKLSVKPTPKQRGKAKVATVAVSFAGNAALLPAASAATATFRLG